jgi:peroxiredoxin
MQLIRIRKSLTGIFLVGLILLAVPAVAVTLSPGDKAPNFSLKDIDGNKVSLDQFRGKTVVIAFWSTWCSRCDEELTFLKESFGKRSDVVVLLVNQDSEKSVSLLRVRTVKEKLGITFPILMDEGLALWDGFGINALPTSIVIGKNGVVKMVEPNFYWASPEKLLEAVEQG